MDGAAFGVARRVDAFPEEASRRRRA